MKSYSKDYTSRLLLFSALLNILLIFIVAVLWSSINIAPEPKFISTDAIEIVQVKGEQIQLPKSLSEREQIDIYIQEVSSLYSIDPALISAIIWRESRYDPNAKNGSCLGLMQVCTTWHSDRAYKLGVTDFLDPYSSILLGVDYISELLKQNNDDVGLTLMLYNMNHKQAYALHKRGELSSYAISVLEKVEEIKQGVK